MASWCSAVSLNRKRISLWHPFSYCSRQESQSFFSFLVKRERENKGCSVWNCAGARGGTADSLEKYERVFYSKERKKKIVTDRLLRSFVRFSRRNHHRLKKVNDSHLCFNTDLSKYLGLWYVQHENSLSFLSYKPKKENNFKRILVRVICI